jgi:hypothetical protein
MSILIKKLYFVILLSRVKKGTDFQCMDKISDFKLLRFAAQVAILNSLFQTNTMPG